MNIKPLNDRVIVSYSPPEEKTASGLFIPDSAKKKPREGTVEACGEGKYENGHHIPMSIKVGDNVLFGAFSGAELTIDGMEYLIMNETDIFGII